MTRWGIAPGQSLRHRCWQEEYVVYNDLSGDTHLLSGAAWELLDTLRHASLATAELADLFGLDDKSHGDLDAMLGSLQQLGLVVH